MKASGARGRSTVEVAAVLALSAVASPVAAAPPALDVARLDAYVLDAMARDRVPGLALAVTHGDAVVYARGYGRADAGGRAVTPDTPFALGSLSKSFTALAVLQLVEAGRLDLDGPVQRYLPWFRLADAEHSRRVTLRHLLQHTSGIPAAADRSFATGSNEEKARRLASVRPAHPPGTAFQYANPNYQVLGLVVEQASGRPFEEYVTEQVFLPLRMRRSFASGEAARGSGPATGHVVWFGIPVATERPATSGPAEGGLWSTAADLSRYLRALGQGGRFDGERVLGPEGVRMLLHGGFALGAGRSYAMGWFERPLAGVPTVSHGGSTPGFQSFAAMAPGGEWGVVVLANQWSAVIGAGAPTRMATGIVSMLAGRQPPAPGWGLARTYLVFDAALLALTALEWRSWRRTLREGAGRPPRRRLALSGVGDLALTLAVVWAVPAYFRVSLNTLLAVPSDFGWLFKVGLTLGIARGLVRLGLAARRRAITAAPASSPPAAA